MCTFEPTDATTVPDDRNKNEAHPGVVGVLILARGDELCSVWDTGISKGMHTDSVAMATTTQLRILPNEEAGIQKKGEYSKAKP